MFKFQFPKLLFNHKLKDLCASGVSKSLGGSNYNFIW